jgi:hypothetical protein
MMQEASVEKLEKKFQYRGDIMRGGYESLVWLNDKDGKEFVCSIDDFKSDKKSFDELTDEEKSHCENVNQLVGTERW